MRTAPRSRVPQPIGPPLGEKNDTHPNYIFALADQNGRVIIPAPGYQLGTQISPPVLADGIPLDINGQFVGTVITTGNPPELDPREQSFLDRTNRVLIFTAAGAATAALILGVILARSLTNPLHELTVAIRAMGQGNLGHQVDVRAQDEIGELAQTFNQMSAELAHLNEQRKQMTADIAHDLRTPLTVLGGYLEAMQEGVLAPTPTRLETMHTEIKGLIHLVEALRTLSLADAGQLHLNCQFVQAQYLLDRVASAFFQQAREKEIQIQVQVSPDMAQLHIDPERFHQALSNLVANALRHTPSGGMITLSAAPHNGRVLLRVADTGAGISAELLPHVFDRFFRGDRARTQQGGETGLGLAIVKSIVEAHHGQVSVMSAGPNRGTTFEISLPV